MFSIYLHKLFFPHDDKVDHRKALDGLRGLAIIIVLLSHTANVGLFFHPAINFQQAGKIGVYLFFVLSAYLLDKQIALAFINRKASADYWKNYFLRRFLRIYPLYVFALIVYAAASQLGADVAINQLKDLPRHLLLLDGKDVFWSIPVEFKYYLISPVILWFCHTFLKWHRIYTFYFFGILAVVSVFLGLTFQIPIISTTLYLPVFLVGTYISVYEVSRTNYTLPHIRPVIVDMLALLSLILLFISFPFYFEKLFHRNIKLHFSVSSFVYALLWGTILFAIFYGRGIIKKILEGTLLRFMGNISFSVYLFHMLLLKIVIHMPVHNNLMIYIFFLLTISVSALTYLIIERPLSSIRWSLAN